MKAMLHIKGTSFGRLQVLIHGEYAEQNLLFNYKDVVMQHSLTRKSPVSVKMVDFQWCQLGSPAVDLLHLIYTSADDKLLLEKREFLINTYHTEIMRILNSYGLKEEVFSRQKLDQDLKDAELYGVVQGLTLRWIRPLTNGLNVFQIDLNQLMSGECMSESLVWRHFLKAENIMKTMKQILDDFEIPNN